MLFLFDEKSQLIGSLGREELTVFQHKIVTNAFDEAWFELPCGVCDDWVFQAVFFGFFVDEDKEDARTRAGFFEQEFRVFRITQRELEETIHVRGIDRAESDLRGACIIEDRRLRHATAEQALTVALSGTFYEVGSVEGLPYLGTVNFYYESPRAALVKIIEKWRCEFRVSYGFANNQIIQPQIHLASRFGGVCRRQFVHGDDVLSIKLEENRDDLVTALVGRGRGEETESGGFGRRILFTDVEWSRAKGDPIDKPRGQSYITDEAARVRSGIWHQGEMRHRWGVFVDENIEDPTQLLEETYKELLRLRLPLTTYEAKVVKLKERIGCGDTIAILRPDVNVVLQARVHELVIDKLDANLSEVTIGDYATLSGRTSSTGSSGSERPYGPELDQELDEARKEYQDFLLLVEQKLENKDREFQEAFDQFTERIDVKIEAERMEAQAVKDAIKSELDEEVKGLLERERNWLKEEITLPEVNKLRQEIEKEKGAPARFAESFDEKLKDLSEKSEVFFGLIGGDGETHYSTNVLEGETDRTLTLKEESLRLRPMGGFRVGEPYVLSFSARCQEYGYLDVVVDLVGGLDFDRVRFSLVPVYPLYPRVDGRVGESVLRHVYYGPYTLEMVSDWGANRYGVEVKSGSRFSVDFICHPVADAQAVSYYVGEWAEGASLVLDAGG